MKRFVLRRFVAILCTSGLLGMSTQAMATSFQLWEQDGASIGNYHAGYAAAADDASTAWYNPAGMTRIKNQQVILGALSVLSDFTYKGSVGVTELSPFLTPVGPATLPTTATFSSVTAQGGSFSLVPFVHYVAPINDRIAFGFSVDAPFGLKTSYGSSTPLRYAATLTSLTVTDISPSLALKVTDKTSVGFGFDVQRAYAEFNSVAGIINSVITAPLPRTVLTVFDTTSTNYATNTGYGYHLGALYEFTPNTRIGISYHSQVTHHLTGSSKFVGPLADEFNGGPMSSYAVANVTLPAYTALSFFDKVNPSWAIMGTVIYTQWTSFHSLTLNGVSGLVNGPPNFFPLVASVKASNDIQVTMPQNYQNIWNLALGADYYPTDGIILRGGLGYDQTPLKDDFRTVQLPDNDRFVIAAGAHFQATKKLGFDVSWLHVFIKEARINPPPQANGAETVTTNGQSRGGADVFAGQVVWDMT